MASVKTLIKQGAEEVLGTYLAPKMAKQAATELADALAETIEAQASGGAEALRAKVLKALGVDEAPSAKAEPKRASRKKAGRKKPAAPAPESSEAKPKKVQDDEARKKMSIKRKVYHAVRRLDAGKPNPDDAEFLAAHADEVELLRKSQAEKKKGKKKKPEPQIETASETASAASETVVSADLPL